MLNLSLNELKLVAKLTGIKVYKSSSKERLVSALSESESVEISNLYDIKNPKNLSSEKIKEIEESLFKLEERLSNFENYLPQDDLEHRNIKDIINLFNRVALNEITFNQSINEDYYRPIRTKKLLMVITSNMQAKEAKTKIYHLKNILICFDHIYVI